VIASSATSTHATIPARNRAPSKKPPAENAMTVGIASNTTAAARAVIVRAPGTSRTVVGRVGAFVGARTVARVRARIRDRAVPLALSALALLLAILQRPGWSSSDTKIDLHVDPVRFLGEIAALWTPSSGLGGVESAQYAGYLFPMGPFFALGHVLGISDWLVDRLWLGLLLAIGCWGAVRLVETLGAVRTRQGTALAGLIFLVNPYVVVLANRTTVTLLAYALMPWLVIVALRGVREPRRWKWAAVFALLTTAAGGGINAAVVALVLVAPLALVLYEAALRVVAWRALWQFGWRTVVATLAASLWWIAPTAAQTKYGVDFLRFTEPAGAIWATTSLSESFRVMGYWISYIGVGFNGVVRPYFSDAGTLLFNHLVVTASLWLPGFALLGFAWTRRRRYAAWFLTLVLAATLIMTIGFPEGTPLRRGATFAYNHAASVRFLRTTYKAGPLLVLGLAGLAGIAVDLLSPARRRTAIAVAACAVLAIGSWPLVSGKAVDKQVSWKHIPAGWTAAAHDLDAQLGNDSRAAVLPGQLYAFYRWGGTVDPILPSLSKKPVAVRNAVPYSDLRATDLLWTTDSLLQQNRLLPGQLAPLARLMSVGRVVNATDDDVYRSGATNPQRSARALAAQHLGRAKNYGSGVTGYTVAAARPLVRVEPRAPMTIVDGSADGLGDLAALGALPSGKPFMYAADLQGDALRAAAHDGGTVVISDSNRKRVFVVSRMQQNTGWTLGADDTISADAATLDPWPQLGSQAQTVAAYHGARSISAPFSPGYSQFPEHRPYAAFDGNPRTAWLADPALQPARDVVTITFAKPRDVPSIRVLPRNEAGARVTSVVVNGRRFPVGSGWTRLPLGLTQARALSLRVIAAKTGSAGAGGLAEVQIPGLHVTESLRPPVLAENALRGGTLRRVNLVYSFSRASGDDPLHHTSSAGAVVNSRVRTAATLEQLRVDQPGDEEVGIDRVIAPPVARTYSAKAWLSVTPGATDSSIDRLVRARGPLRADSSSRLDNRPGLRASSAVDGDPATAWVAPYPGVGRGEPWIGIHLRRPISVRTLRMLPPPGGERRPTRVRLTWPGGQTGSLTVNGGRVALPSAIRTDSFTLHVLAAAGNGGGVGMGELQIAGMPRLHVPRTGPISGCGAVRISAGATSAGMRLQSGIAALDAGGPLSAVGCRKLALPAGPQRIQIPPRTLRPDKVLLSSPAPAPLARSGPPVGRVTNAGDPGRGTRSNVKLDVHAPAWLVLGESYDKGWRASCNGQSLGAPVPMDGFANAWPIDPGCRSASFSFAPQKPVRILQLLSALACLLLLGIALLPRRREPESLVLAPDPADDPIARWPLPRAALAGLIAGAVLAFCFSLRSGLVIAPAIAIVLWRGIGAKPLALVGGALLIVAVPLEYILFPPRNLGDYNGGFAGDAVGGHWIAVGAWVLLALALWRALSTASRRRDGPSAAPADAGA
jgi:arabinofuranan 3-O-arabinosyltransferase